MAATRRKFMKITGLCSLSATFWLAGCGGEKEKAEPAASLETADPCTDLSELSEAQVQLRDTFGYVETSDDPDLACRVCEYWTEPAAGGFCGGCTLMAGPIHPAGSCDSYEEA